MSGSTGQAKAIAYVGSAGPPRGEGNYIYVFKVESITDWRILQVVKDITYPIFLMLNRCGNHLYCCSAPGNFTCHSGCLTSYKIERKTGLIIGCSQISFKQLYPCHMAVDNDEKHIVCVHKYGGVGVVELNNQNGFKQSKDLYDIRCAETVKVTYNAQNVKEYKESYPYKDYRVSLPSMITFAPVFKNTINPKSECIFVADHALNRVLLFQYESTKGIISRRMAGSFLMPEVHSGPSKMVMNKVHNIYILNELTSTVCFFYFLAVDDQKARQTISTLPENWVKFSNRASAIVLHPDQEFMYVANTVPATIAIISIDSLGLLELLTQHPSGGKSPEYMQVFQQHLMVCHEKSHNVTVFGFAEGGRSLVLRHHVENVLSPVCIVFKHQPSYD